MNELVKINRVIEEKLNQYETVHDIVDYIVNKIQPIMIFLFGSCARGVITKHSDIDLCVIVNEQMTPKERVKLRSTLLLDLLDITDFEVDIFICSEEEWEEKHRNQGTFIGKIYKEGKMLYGG